jgi:hypothetical protein
MNIEIQITETTPGKSLPEHLASALKAYPTRAESVEFR